MPKRIQRRRTKGWRMPEGAVYVGRPSLFGNPFQVSVYGRGESLRLFRLGIENDWTVLLTVAGYQRFLRGKDLACWCHLCDKHKDGKPLGVECLDCAPCHVDYLLEVANGPEASR